MREIPVDTSGLQVVCMGEPSPKVADRATGEVKTDAEGRTVWQVEVAAKPADASGGMVRISVSGEPKGLTFGQLLRVEGLVALPWEQNDRHGIAFRAAKIEPLSPSTASTKPVRGGGEG